MAECCISLQRAPPRLEGQCRKRTLLVWKIYECAMTAGDVGYQRWQQGCNLYRGKLCYSWWQRSWWEGARREETRLQLWAQRKERETRSIETGEKHLVGTERWKDESRPGNFSCMEVWGHSFEVLCIRIYTEAWYKKPRWRKSQSEGADKFKAQTADGPVMLATVTGKSSSKESLEDGLRALVSHTELEPMARHSERSRLSFGLGQKGAYGRIWVISASSWACVYRWVSPERRCPLLGQEGRRPRAEPFGAHRKLEKNRGMLFSCSSMWFVDNKSF